MPSGELGEPRPAPFVPARQIHLDFHTSEWIEGVGERFDKSQFQAALRLGRVQSINLFAKCHHSWSYYPTRVGRPHPHLRRNLLGEQIEACHEIGVRAPIYFTVGWSANDAESHPEWAVRNRDGSVVAVNVDSSAKPDEPRPNFSWIFLCPSGGYLDLMLEQTREICADFPVDGFWYDICQSPTPCFCENCARAMRDRSMDPSSGADAASYYIQKWVAFQEATRRIILESHPNALLFYNGMTKMESPPEFTARMTHIELEDLPTTWGGYDKFPLRANFYAKTGKPLVAMSGKFHTSWGEFGGFKHPDAMRYEAAAMLAWGSACCFGDQLHPAGEMDMETYRLIGEAFHYVETVEEFGLGGRTFSDLGLWLSNSVPDDQGVANMLMETQTVFDVVGGDEDLSRYSAIVLTGAARLDKSAAARIDAFMKAGGGILALGESGLDPSGGEFLLDLGARHLGTPEFDVDYLELSGEIGDGIVRSPFLNYRAGERVELAGGAALATIREPYFRRTYRKFCSHQNTPPRAESSGRPGAVRKGRSLYLAHRVGEMYYRHGARVHRDYFTNALRSIYPEPLLRVELPSAGRANLLHQPAQSRYVAHLLYAPPLQRGRCLVIEDLPRLREVPLSLALPRQIRRAWLAPKGEGLEHRREKGRVGLVVPELRGFQSIVFEY